MQIAEADAGPITESGAENVAESILITVAHVLVWRNRRKTKGWLRTGQTGEGRERDVRKKVEKQAEVGGCGGG